MPGVIHPNDVKDELDDIDAEYADLLCRGTCLLWVNGCPRYCNRAGSLKPHWKEAGPFHYNHPEGSYPLAGPCSIGQSLWAVSPIIQLRSSSESQGRAVWPSCTWPM